MTEASPHPERPARSKLMRIAIWLILSISAVLMLLATQSWPAFILLMWHSLLGWAFHLQRLSDTLHWSFETVLLSLAALVAASVILQRLIRSRFPAMPLRSTIRIAAIVLCGAAAAIVTSGIMHQSAWLLQKPVFYKNNRFQRNDARLNTHLILLALQEYFTRHNYYPVRLTDLLRESKELKPESLFYQLDPDEDTLQPIIYLRPMIPEGEQAAPDTILLVARMQDRIYAGRADLTGRYVQASALEKECPGLTFPPPSSF